ncbi:MAG: hydantoinase/oxoprolinase family protein [Alphaproteobacteria bacterium]
MYRLGIDVGGTFTDFTLLNAQTGATRHFKASSTPRDPSESIRDGIAAILALEGIDGAALRFLGHGTTVATNMAIERRGARTGLITTQGFRDVLEVGRQIRPHLYDYTQGKPPPLVPRRRRHQVVERIGADGAVLTPLDEAGVATALAALAKEDVAAVAVCFLHCYQAPDHERRVRAMIEDALPHAYISLSSEVLPEFREYERLSTTVLNAYLGPAMANYLNGFLESVRRLAPKTEPYTIHSNGGLMTAATARDYPVRTCLSGPAAGVVGAAETARDAGFPNIITFDVGGTSTDVSVVSEGRPSFTADRRVAGHPVRTPMLDIHVIGAGGGSIAWIDDAGGLKVGPRSAGANPGPVAYGLGGTEPTITDANIALGRLNPGGLLEGTMAVDADAAGEAIRRRVAEPLGLAFETAAHGIIEIAIANMSRAIRSVTTERGHDMADFALFAFGGAGPLHAAELALECGIPKIIVPEEPGTMCARGILLSDIVHDLVRSAISRAEPDGWQRVCDLFAEMVAEGHTLLERDGVPKEKRAFRHFIEARYVGQNYEVRVEIDDAEAVRLDGFLEAFAARHTQEYGYDIAGRPVETVNCRSQAIGQVALARPTRERGTGSLADAVTGERDVYFGAVHGWRSSRVYRRRSLPEGAIIEGPAVIEEMSATTLLLPGQLAALDGTGNIVIETGA